MIILIWSKKILATFDEFYASLDPNVGVRGKQFEKLTKNQKKYGLGNPKNYYG